MCNEKLRAAFAEWIANGAIGHGMAPRWGEHAASEEEDVD